MKFEKIIIPPGWKDNFTKYPNGKTIFEALSSTITTVNEGIEEVNQIVNQGLVAIDQAENTIRQEITESFNTLKLQLEAEITDLSDDLIADFALLQSEVLTLIAGKANAADVYTKQQVDAQLAEKVQNFKLKNDIKKEDFTSNASNLALVENKIVATLTALTAANQINQGSLIGVVNNKYYLRGQVKGKYNNPIYLMIGGVQTPSINAVPNVFTTVSGVVNCKNTERFRFYHPTNTQYVMGDVIEYNIPLVINLTHIFGAGNEPTKLEMDELVKIIPNQWWDGELTLTQKQVVTWMLNLQRKTTNAVIALGGTII